MMLVCAGIWPNLMRSPLSLRRRPALALALALTLIGAGIGTEPAQAATLDVAWLEGGRVTTRQLNDGARAGQDGAFDGSRMVPLGSVWKLFVYLYALDQRVPMPDYRCAGRLPDEVYCCEAGASIGRDAALAQSCGLFFMPARLGLAHAPWKTYWDARLGRTASGEFGWLADPAQLAPERLVSLHSLLLALSSLPAASRADAEAALLHVVLGGRGADTVGWFGSRLRVKTFSWHEPQRPSVRLGGAAGWLSDGTPLWFGGAGSSSAVLQKWAPQLAAILPATPPAADAGCVLVDYFARYPLKAVHKTDAAAGAVTAPGPLHGSYQVRFENGQSLALRSQGELVLERDGQGHPRLRGRLGVNDYVARVLEREGSSTEPEAAKALAIAARTYLQQNARRSEGCQRIADSSATQRVSPNPAGAPARAIAGWTDQLVLTGANVRYHRDTAARDTLVWRTALEQASQGQRFDAILAAAYPRAELGTLAGGGALRCVRLPLAEAWLARALPRWQRLLRSETGYQAPAELPAVCELAAGTPYSEQSRNRIFARAGLGREERITLAHEFLHLGLRYHPRGQDEAAVEQLARRLVDVSLETQQ